MAQGGNDRPYRELQTKFAGHPICAPEALRLEKRDDRIFTPVAKAHELLVMRGESADRPYPVPHPQAV